VSTTSRRTPPPYLTDSLPARNGWPVGFAHRGADVHRENTLAAFEAAVDAGFGHLELDVQTTRDGVLVCFHDDTLDRVTTGRGRIADHTWAELQDVRTGGEPLLPFEDLLRRWDDVRLNVDLKGRDSTQEMVRLVAEHDAWDRVLFASFDDARRRHVRRAIAAAGYGDRRVAFSGGQAAIAALVALGPLGLAKVLARWAMDIDCLQVPVAHRGIPVVTPGFVRRAHTAGLAVHVWVIDEAEEMERLLEMGVDGIMTDRADVLAEVFTRRGIWPQR
jgi:glycerophosphoryl diester phosphodiesterase